jgi:peptide deformylase
MLIKKKDGMSISPVILSFREYREKHEARIATIVDHDDWVKTRARDIDVDKELLLARDLDKIMRYFREQHTFVGVSSNNIYWNLTRTPIRQILIPAKERGYITLLNPKIIKLEGEDNSYVEACGSIPGKVYAVKRKPYVLISGYTLGKQYIELEYGSKDYYSGGELIHSSYSHQEWIIQHEMDHLDGITIADKATKLIWEFYQL